MSLRRMFMGVLLGAALAAFAGSAVARNPVDCAIVTRANLGRCALDANLILESERWRQEAAQGRLEAASPWLPANPTLALTGAQRTAAGEGPTVTNWTATLSQPLEIAGQRGARRAAASAELRVVERQRATVARDVVAHAWAAYFDVLAARELVQVAGKLEAALQQLQEAARGRAERGLLAPVEADIAEIARLKATQEQMAAVRQVRTSQANLALALGVTEGGPELQVTGDLTPITVPVAARATEASRSEIAALEAEKRAFSERARVFRRARVPDVTLSVFAQRDGFAERVLGVGVALPLPLPSPVGRTFAGEIAEAEALSRRAESELERKLRELRSSLWVARAEYDSRRAELELFTPERRARAEQTLRDLASEIVAGRLSVREAIMTEQSLIEFLRGYVEARHALCAASVELARASGVAFERGEQ